MTVNIPEQSIPIEERCIFISRNLSRINLKYDMYCVTLVIYKHCDDASTDNDQDLFPFLYFYVWKCIETTSYIQKKDFPRRSQWVQILYKLSQAVFLSEDLPTLADSGSFLDC